MLAKESDLVEVSPGNRASGLYVLPRILLPLAGPEDFEVDVRSRVFAVLFC